MIASGITKLQEFKQNKEDRIRYIHRICDRSEANFKKEREYSNLNSGLLKLYTVKRELLGMKVDMNDRR